MVNVIDHNIERVGSKVSIHGLVKKVNLIARNMEKHFTELTDRREGRLGCSWWFQQCIDAFQERPGRCLFKVSLKSDFGDWSSSRGWMELDFTFFH